ncbi:uncharacterized protein LOC133181268 [Saccostrea echinata]|uniref:uncharacterized protein LOC133181268 n=1 Tax=Saccostrea echinata TaxID=191078 RepID=UPI002A80C362|nr:uncharacterized protein LOC133181268 [Saccostrea echinata]
MDKDYTLLGVVLKGDNSRQEDRCLGAVKVFTSQIVEVTLDWLKDVMRRQLVCFLENLHFCTKEGWSIKADLEKSLKIQDVLTEEKTVLVQRSQNEKKIAIQNTEREVLGFVLCAVQSKLSHLRSLIEDQILDEGNRSFLEFQFLEQNGWPVSPKQESSLSVLDVLNERHVMIRFKSSLTRVSPQYKAGTVNRKRHLSFRSSKDLERVSPADSSVGDVTGSVKQILISYVRAEAAQHALRLKQELSALGFSVYLDVHEIRSGLDWQDSLNYAVSNCEFFVALVTPKYGETQWTNREIKLADVLGKFIVPVSFLDSWPPQCLAIQFATTQYIDWKTQAQITAEIAEGSNSAKDIKVWEHRHIRDVACKIKDHLIKAKEKALQKKTSLVKRKTVVKSCTLIEENNDQASLCNRDGCPLVVVCVHVNQQQLSAELADFIRSLGCEVWCTITDKVEGQNDCSNLGDENRDSFQEKADDAGVVIVLLSSDFIHSRTCQQQLYYCEQRKKVVPLLTDNTQIPSWLEMMLQSNTYTCVEKRNYKEHLPKVLKKLFDPKARQSCNAELEEARVSYAVKQLKKLLRSSLCVYICGPSVCENIRSDLIRLLGKVLSEFEDVTMVTGGGYNIEYMVSHAFLEETQQNLRPHKVWHVLPEQEKQDVSKDYPQNSDGTFQVISFGQTYFCGNSQEERDLIISKAVEVCLIVIGDSDVKYLRLAKKFAWNDHHVIPFVVNMEGDSTFTEQLSHGISLEDFRALNDPKGAPERRAYVLRDILTRIQANLEMEQKEEESQEMEMSPPRKMLRKSPSKGSSTSHKKVSLKSLNTVIL